jgi:hypothetical protein
LRVVSAILCKRLAALFAFRDPARTARSAQGRVRCRISSLAPPGPTGCVLMTFGLRCSEPACRPHPASLPVRIPTVGSFPPTSFGFTSRLPWRTCSTGALCGSATVAVIGPDWLLSSKLDSAHAGHTPRPDPWPASSLENLYPWRRAGPGGPARTRSRTRGPPRGPPRGSAPQRRNLLKAVRLKGEGNKPGSWKLSPLL